MPSLSAIHKKFWKDLIEVSKLSNRAYTILPSIFFLSCSFVLLYLHFHKWTTSFTRWRARLYKDLIFHWAFFYNSRLWFGFLKGCKWLLSYVEWLIDESANKRHTNHTYWNKMMAHFCIFSLVLSISLIPCLILTIKRYNRQETPNFLMWVAEDPWVRSEIGTSGHYLERPPRTAVVHPSKNTAFRSRRSSSADTNISLEKPNDFRNCKSMMTVSAES